MWHAVIQNLAERQRLQMAGFFTPGIFNELQRSTDGFSHQPFASFLAIKQHHQQHSRVVFWDISFFFSIPNHERIGRFLELSWILWLEYVVGWDILLVPFIIFLTQDSEGLIKLTDRR